MSSFKSILGKWLVALWISLPLEIHAASLYVWTNSPFPAPPFDAWSNAAHVIQTAIEAASPGDTVWVTNGIYDTGGFVVAMTLTSRVALTKAILVQSVQGAEKTIIKGTGPIGPSAVRCAYLTNGATLSGFTLTNGCTSPGLFDGTNYTQFGGGALLDNGGRMTDCIITRCSASQSGGGAMLVYGGLLSNCLVEANDADFFGGGVTCLGSGIVNNCTLRYNTVNFHGGGLHFARGGLVDACLIYGNISTNSGGGASLLRGGTIRNSILRNNHASGAGGVACDTGGEILSCVIFDNSAVYSAGGVHFYRGGQMRNSICTGNSAPTNMNWTSYSNDFSNYVACATTPALGERCITNDPLFVDILATNFHLQINSPCLNAGVNDSWMMEGVDREGQPRINNVFVDMGAFELPVSTSAIPIQWLWTNGLASDGTADYEDDDEDGMNNWEEWRCQTQPTNPASNLSMKPWVPTHETNAGIVLSWAAEEGLFYGLQRSTSLVENSFSTISSHLPGTWPLSVFTDSTAIAIGTPLFYRVTVE